MNYKNENKVIRVRIYYPNYYCDYDKNDLHNIDKFYKEVKNKLLLGKDSFVITQNNIGEEFIINIKNIISVETKFNNTEETFTC